MGEIPTVCVSEYKKIIETFQKDGDAYAGRTWFHEISWYLAGTIPKHPPKIYQIGIVNREV